MTAPFGWGVGADFEPIAKSQPQQLENASLEAIGPVTADRLSDECVQWLMRAVAMGLKPELAAIRQQIADARAPMHVKRWSSSALEIKSVDQRLRRIRGWASVGSEDRTGDIVCPEGLTYELPMVLLFNHNTAEPVGHVVEAQPRDNGMWFTAVVAKSKTPGMLADRLTQIWDMLTSRLLGHVSIGFVPLQSEPIKGGHGRRFLRAEWCELSIVSVPAHPGARIVAVDDV